MKTEALIEILARGPRDTGPIGRRMAAGLLGAGALCTLTVLVLFGPRPDLHAALSAGRLASKLTLTLAVAGAALVLLTRLGVPGRVTPWWQRCLPLLVLVAGSLGLASYGLPTSSAVPVASRLFTAATLRCVGLVSLLSALSLPVLLHTYRRYAPTAPALFAFHLGLGSSAIAATAYVLTCRQDDPLFVAVWYGLTMLTVASVSALVVRRWLRW